MDLSFLYSHIDVDGTATRAKLAEMSGAAGLWIDDASTDPDPYVTLAHVAGRVGRISLGICVTNPLTRHIVSTARAISSLQEVTGGRAILGIGRGASALRPTGLEPLSTRAMGEAVSLVKRLVAGETVDYRSAWANLVNARLSDVPVPTPAVYLAGSGPKMLEMAGIVADGAIISVGSSRECVRFAVGQIRKGMLTARREKGKVRVVAHVFTALARTRGDAIDRVREEALWLATNRPKLAKIAGIEVPAGDGVGSSGSLREAEGGADRKRSPASNEIVEKFALAGTPEDLVPKLRMMKEEGVDEVMLSLKHDWEYATSAVREEIAPGIR